RANETLPRICRTACDGARPEARRTSGGRCIMQPSTSSAIDRILQKLQRVRALGNGKYIACCPAHQDATPSLSLAVAGDGRVLLKCFASCDADSIVAALGLSLADLFPNSQRRYHPESKAERKRRAIDGLRAWVQYRLVHVCDLLRDMEELIRITS